MNINGGIRLRCRQKRHEYTFDTILKDVPRSFGESLRSFDTPECREALAEVLLVVAGHLGYVGYTQGMNFICILALAHMSKEMTFWFLVRIITILPVRFFRHTGLDEVNLFCTIVSKHAPLVRNHLGSGEAFERGMGYLLVQWFVPLFVHVLPLKTTLCVWDMLFDGGNVLSADNCGTEEEGARFVVMLHRVAFSLLEIHSGPLLSCHRRLERARDEHMRANAHRRKKASTYTNALLNEEVEKYTHMGFMQKLVIAASRDTG